MPKYKLSDLPTAEEIHQEDLKDPEYRAEWERTALARAVSELVASYRVRHKLSQTALARKLGTNQANISRLESGEHNPTFEMLARIVETLGVELVVDITPGDRSRRELVNKRAADNAISEFEQGSSRVLFSAA